MREYILCFDSGTREGEKSAHMITTCYSLCEYWKTALRKKRSRNAKTADEQCIHTYSHSMKQSSKLLMSCVLLGLAYLYIHVQTLLGANSCLRSAAAAAFMHRTENGRLGQGGQPINT